MYRLEKEQSGAKRVEEIIETKEGSLSRLLSIDNRPLSEKQQEEENKRVQELMTSRSAKRKLQRELEDATLQGRRLFKMLPDAFVFDYAGDDGNVVKLSFRPNPNFHPHKGGHFEVRQAEVVPGHWDLTNMSVEITGKALLFATIGMRKNETHGDFYQVSHDLTLAEAADMLNRKLVVADSH
jgi:hypothetical protein